MNKEKLVAAAVLSLITYTLALSLANSAIAPSTKNRKLSSTGGIRANAFITIYSDPQSNNTLSSIDWGLIDPGGNTTITAYVRNQDNSALTLSFVTENWNPLSASQYMTLSWDYGGQPINSGEVIKITFTLEVSPNVSGITDFSFDIIIVGTATRATK